MGGFFIVFVGVVFVFMRVFFFGVIGLVFVNIINMLCWIIWSGFFIISFFNKYGIEFGILLFLLIGVVVVFVVNILVMRWF